MVGKENVKTFMITDELKYYSCANAVVGKVRSLGHGATQTWAHSTPASHGNLGQVDPLPSPRSPNCKMEIICPHPVVRGAEMGSCV